MNDDVILYQNAFKIIYKDLKKVSKSILVGVFETSQKNSKQITYGGRDKNLQLLIPDGNPKSCLWMNGNFVFISKEIFDKVGLLSKIYTHNFGDVDYGLRAIKMGFQIYISSKVIGTCEANQIEPWRDPKKNIIQRIKSFSKTKNFRIKEIVYFQLLHFGMFKLLKYLLGIILILISPKIYYLLIGKIKGKSWEV